MSKFHLIHVDDAQSGTYEEAELVAKSTGGKTLLFKSPSAYASKIMSGMQPATKNVAEVNKSTFVEPAVKMQPYGSS